jgi:hypothetical protein
MAQSTSAPDDPPATPAPNPSEPAPGAGTNEGAPSARTELNLLGETDTKSGESRRNENIQFNLIDNNAQKELNVRLGVTATFRHIFEVNRNYFGTEYGNAPTTPLALSANFRPAWHGFAQWTHQNSITAARAFFQVGSVLPARENDFVINAGGPVAKDTSLFIEGSLKRIRGQVNGNVLIPLPGERIPLATDPAVARVVQSIINQYPDVAPNRPDIDARMLNTNSPQSIDNESLSGRLDHKGIVLRHAYLTQKVTAFQLVKGQNPDTTTRSHRSSATWNKAWSPRTVTSLAAGFERAVTLIVPEPNNLGPAVFVSGALTVLNGNNALPINRFENKFRYSAFWQHTKGKHTFSAGAELLRRQLNGFEGDSTLGAFSFANNFGFDALTTLRLGLPTFYYVSVAVTPLDRGFRNWDNLFTFSGQSQLHNRFTLNYGASYRPMLVPYEVNNRNQFNYSNDWNNLGPHLGFAWKPSTNEKWGVLRGGYGLHFGEIFPVTYQQVRFNAPDNVKLVIPNPNILNPFENLPDFSVPQRTVLYTFAEDIGAPAAHQYSLVWELAPTQLMRWELGYVGSRAANLLQRWFLNRAQQIPGIPLTTGTIDERRPDPRYNDVRYVTASSRAWYDAFKTTIRIPAWRNLNLETSYWFSKSMDLGSSFTNTAYDTDAFNNRSQDEFLTHEDLKARSDFDQPHAFLARGGYNLPWRGKRIGNWTLNGVFLAKQGTPFNLRSGSDAPGFGNVDGVSGDRPDIIDPSILGRTIGHPDTSRQRMPRSAFGFMPVGAMRGNVGRNVFRRGPIRNLNSSLEGTWILPRETRLTLRAESINLTNTPQFAEPGTALTDPNFAAITNTLNDGRAFRFLLRFGF